MNRHIQFSTQYNSGRKQTDVMEYGPADMEEVFTAHERLWLSEGKIVERTDAHGTTQIVDLQAWFNRTNV